MPVAVLQALNTISEQLWDEYLDDATFATLTEMALKLSARIAVHQTLQKAARELSESENSHGPLTASTRIGKILDAAFTNPNTGKFEERWRKLRNMDCETFLLIAISYTPPDITKMSQNLFDCLVDIAPKFQIEKLPPRWIFRKGIQRVILDKANEDFRRGKYTPLRSTQSL